MRNEWKTTISGPSFIRVQEKERGNTWICVDRIISFSEGIAEEGWTRIGLDTGGQPITFHVRESVSQIIAMLTETR